MKSLSTYMFPILLFCIFSGGLAAPGAASSEEAVAAGVSAHTDPIRPYRNNPWYWEYRGEPVLLIGASDQDNLFQWTGRQLTDHLDLLGSAGGNYLRNTMSDRDEGNVHAFARIEGGLHDLEQWNEDYWNRLEFFLEQTRERQMVVQLSLWDTFDLGSPWGTHPWNPANNRNWTAEVIDSRADFYASVERGNEKALRYQNRFIDKLLSITFRHDHVLYNINNESSQGVIWENYWAEYILRTAGQAGVEVYVTSMQFDPSNSVRHAMTYPDLYSFVEISQNNQDSRGGRGPVHYNNIINWRNKLGSFGPRPMNNEKVYGGADGVNYSAGTAKEAVERFWRNIFAGAASSRFHRPALPRQWGIGLDERAQTNLKAMSMLLEELDIFNTTPHNDLLHFHVESRNSMEAYCLADMGRQYAIYFPGGRHSVELDPWLYVDRLRARWLDIDAAAWSDAEIIEVKWEGSRTEWGDRGRVRLTTPSNKPYVVLLETIE